MRANIELDDTLIQQVMKRSKLTKKKVVKEALNSNVIAMKKKQLLKLRGKVIWEGNLKEMRSI